MTTASQEHSVRGLAVEFEQIEKQYGALFALRGVSLAVGPGECVALVGPNGSGKTTLLRIAALLVRPSAGRVRFPINGSAGNSTGNGTLAVKPRIALVAHNTLLYDELTAEENLVFFARLYRLEPALEKARAALEPAGLGRRGDDLVRTFSRGMRQRLAIARAMLAAPGLLLLDEPATGLDPPGQQWLRAVLAKLVADGGTIMMSTHGKRETEGLVTRAVRLEAGKIVQDSGLAGDPRPVLATALAADQEA